tara:strand:+ start:1138 stop:1311 length:174 start_codon:yes stop_codon:yes gene_type:complete
MRKILLLIFLLNACSIETNKKDLLISDPKFSDNLSIEDFKIKLKQYALSNEYPNIDN